MKVLIIEDDMIWQVKLQIIAEKAGLDIAPLTANIKDANHILDTQKIELIIADIHLDNENVFDLLTQKKYNTIPTILTTASESKEDFIKAKKLANCLFLVKPFHHHSLLSTIKLIKKNSSIKIINNEKEGNFRVGTIEIKSLYKLLGDDEFLNILELTEKETTILKKRWQEEKTFKEIGEELNVSGSRIQDLYAKILKRTRNKIKSNIPRYKEYLTFTKTKKNKLEILKNSVEIQKNIGINYEIKSSIDSIEELNTKWKNVLYNKNIKTIEDLLQYTKRDLLMFNKLGKFAVLEIEKALIDRGFELK